MEVGVKICKFETGGSPLCGVFEQQLLLERVHLTRAVFKLFGQRDKE